MRESTPFASNRGERYGEPHRDRSPDSGGPQERRRSSSPCPRATRESRAHRATDSPGRSAGTNAFNLLVENRVPGLDGPLVLRAISCGAVFMGAPTYIGNGPNFMVKAIAKQAGYRQPAFFGHNLCASLILVPIYVLVTILLFPPY
jgi:Putative citrate transport